jgi:PAS domain S-box-containing protein
MGNKPPFTILHVDDDGASRYAVSRILRREGYQVLEAASATEALRLVKGHPDLLILDVNLPDMSGFEVCRRVKADPATSLIPVLHLSATYLDDNARVTGLEGGADGYLTLPIEPPVLTATVKALLRMRQAETEVIAAARQWQATFDSINDSVCLMDLQGEVLRCNEAMARFLAKPLAEIVGRTCWELVHGSSEPLPGCPAIQVQRGGKRGTRVLPVGDRWFRVTVDPLLDEAGTLRGTVHIMSDITERHRAEEALRESEERLSLAVEASGVGIYSHAVPISAGAYYSERWAGILGYEPEELPPPDRFMAWLDEQVHPDDRACLWGAYSEFITSRDDEYHVEVRVRHKSGKWVYVEGLSKAAERGEDGQVSHVIGVMSDITERRRAQERDRQAAAAVAAARSAMDTIAAMADGVVLLDLDGNITSVNPAFEGMTGHQLGELVGRAAADFVPEAVLRELPRQEAELPGTESEADVPGLSATTLVSRDGREIPVSFTTSFMRDPAGEVRAMVVTVKDITELKRTEGELRRVNRALGVLSDCNQALLHASEESELLRDVCRIVVDVGGYTLAWAGLAEQDESKRVRPVAQAGYEEGYLDMVSITWADTGRGRGPTGTAIRTGMPTICRDILTDPDYAPWRAEAMRRGYASSVALPLTTEGSTLGALNIYAAEPDAFDAEEVGFLVRLAENLTYGMMSLRTRAERARAEQALRASDEQYRGLFEDVPVGLYRTTPEGEILEANPSLVHMLGYPDLEHLLTVSVVDLYVDVEERTQWQARIEKEGVLHGAEVRFRRYDGSVLWVRDSARAVRDAAGKVAYYHGYVENITEWKKAQTAMIQAERLAIAGKLAASLTHEINNPLQSVIGCLGLAQETLAEGGDAGQYMQVAREELRRAARVVAQLRDLHRRSVLEERKPVDLNALLEQVLTLSRKQCDDSGVKVNWAVATDLPPQVLAADQMEQVLLNLVLNALDAMPKGGRLQVSTSRTSEPVGVSIEFADSGVGIAEDVLPHIFEPFYSTKSKGLGLGLFVTESIVRRHGGHIEVESEVGRGTVFRVWLPQGGFSEGHSVEVSR